MTDECEMMNGGVAGGQWSVVSGRQISKSDFSPPSSPKRFFFPLVSESRECSSADDIKVVWPNCWNTEASSACAEMADAMLRQLLGEKTASAFTEVHHKIVALTSPGPGDGKTDLLLALAPHLAQRLTGGMLVADADFGKPDLTTRLNASIGAKMDRPTLIYPTNFDRLNVLPASRGVHNRGFDQSWIEELREGWLLTLLDMASLADAKAASLACCCDGVYLVARVGYTSRRAVARTARAIHNSGGRLLGCLAIR